MKRKEKSQNKNHQREEKYSCKFVFVYLARTDIYCCTHTRIGMMKKKKEIRRYPFGQL